MVGQPIAITVTPLGDVKDIKLAPELVAAMKKASPAMSSMFSEDSMKQMISRGMFRFPEEVKSGQTWDSSLEMANPILGKQIVTTEYQYVGAEDLAGTKVEKISMDVKQKIDGTGAQAQVAIKDQSGKGVIYFDNVRGLPLETQATSAMTMEISVGGQKIESKVTTTVTMKQKAPRRQGVALRPFLTRPCRAGGPATGPPADMDSCLAVSPDDVPPVPNGQAGQRECAQHKTGWFGRGILNHHDPRFRRIVAPDALRIGADPQKCFMNIEHVSGFDRRKHHIHRRRIRGARGV